MTNWEATANKAPSNNTLSHFGRSVLKSVGHESMQDSPTYAGPPGAWDIDRNDHCVLETGAVGKEKMARGTQLPTIGVARNCNNCMNHG